MKKVNTKNGPVFDGQNDPAQATAALDTNQQAGPDGGLPAAPCSARSFDLKSNLPSGQVSFSDMLAFNYNLTEMGYNLGLIAGLINTAKAYGVRLLESDIVDNQAEGSYDGVMIFKGIFREILEAINNRSVSALAIEERLQNLRRSKERLCV